MNHSLCQYFKEHQRRVVGFKIGILVENLLHKRPNAHIVSRRVFVSEPPSRLKCHLFLSEWLMLVRQNRCHYWFLALVHLVLHFGCRRPPIKAFFPFHLMTLLPKKSQRQFLPIHCPLFRLCFQKHSVLYLVVVHPFQDIQSSRRSSGQRRLPDNELLTEMSPSSRALQQLSEKSESDGIDPRGFPRDTLDIPNGSVVLVGAPVDCYSC